ncbi:MAG: hypothetical protein ABJA69_12010 [Acidobacteriaceae bacterium]
MTTRQTPGLSGRPTPKLLSNSDFRRYAAQDFQKIDPGLPEAAKGVGGQGVIIPQIDLIHHFERRTNGTLVLRAD